MTLKSDTLILLSQAPQVKDKLFQMHSNMYQGRA